MNAERRVRTIHKLLVASVEAEKQHARNRFKKVHNKLVNLMAEQIRYEIRMERKASC